MGVAVMYSFEQTGNPILARLGANAGLTSTQPAATWKARRRASASPTRPSSPTITTDASCGAVNAMHDSFTPLGGFVPLSTSCWARWFSAASGSGIYGMLVYAILAVFIAGLMVGRTPEYLGKKIEGREMKLAMLAMLYFCVTALGFAALAAVVPAGTDAVLNPGPHGFSEILYAYTSPTGNNGSAFGGLTANTPFWNTIGGLAHVVRAASSSSSPCLALAGSLAGKKTCRRRRARSPSTARCSSCCWSG